MLRDTGGWWSDSVLSVNIGGDGDNPEIIYSATVEREHDPKGYNKTATGSQRVSDEEWAQRVFAAWNENLSALDALLRLPVPAGHEAELSFSAAKELVAQIRAEVPDSKLKAG